MTTFWTALVGMVQGAVTFVAAATGGNVGLAIVLVSIALRVALLPLTIRLARRAAAQQALLAKLKPELARLKARHGKQPDRLAAETMALYRREGVRPFDAGVLGTLLVQAPLFSALASAIGRGLGAGKRFLWIADLAKPDLLLVALTGALTWATSLLGAPRDASRTAAVVAAALTVVITWRVSAALGLYWASSTAIGAVQALALRRRLRPDAAPPR